MKMYSNSFLKWYQDHSHLDKLSAWRGWVGAYRSGRRRSLGLPRCIQTRRVNGIRHRIRSVDQRKVHTLETAPVHEHPLRQGAHYIDSRTPLVIRHWHKCLTCGIQIVTREEQVHEQAGDRTGGT